MITARWVLKPWRLSWVASHHRRSCSKGLCGSLRNGIDGRGHNFVFTILCHLQFAGNKPSLLINLKLPTQKFITREVSWGDQTETFRRSISLSNSNSVFLFDNPVTHTESIKCSGPESKCEARRQSHKNTRGLPESI